jgi:uncharacterized DUF497 family protein
MPDVREELAKCTGFEWDAGNSEKIRERHGVAQGECEEVFFNQPLLVTFDEKHSQDEPRYFGLGQTTAGRPLLVVFTIRGELIRVISAREMSHKEREIYERAQQEEG